jgi:hypothetical protein
MFNNGLPDSSLFCCISFLYLPHCLPAHMTCTVCSYAFYSLCTMSIHCTVPLLFNLVVALSSFFTHESPSTTATTTTPTATTLHLFSVPCTYSFCAPCACNVCNTSTYSHYVDILHLSSTVIPGHHNSSSSLVVPTTRPASLGVMLRFLFLSGS